MAFPSSSTFFKGQQQRRPFYPSVDHMTESPSLISNSSTAVDLDSSLSQLKPATFATSTSENYHQRDQVQSARDAKEPLQAWIFRWMLLMEAAMMTCFSVASLVDEVNNEHDLHLELFWMVLWFTFTGFFFGWHGLKMENKSELHCFLLIRTGSTIWLVAYYLRRASKQQNGCDLCIGISAICIAWLFLYLVLSCSLQKRFGWVAFGSTGADVEQYDFLMTQSKYLAFLKLSTVYALSLGFMAFQSNQNEKADQIQLLLGACQFLCSLTAFFWGLYLAYNQPRQSFVIVMYHLFELVKVLLSIALVVVMGIGFREDKLDSELFMVLLTGLMSILSNTYLLYVAAVFWRTRDKFRGYPNFIAPFLSIHGSSDSFNTDHSFNMDFHLSKPDQIHDFENVISNRSLQSEHTPDSMAYAPAVNSHHIGTHMGDDGDMLDGW